MNENTSPLPIPLPLDQNGCPCLSEPHGPGLLGEGLLTPPPVHPSTHATIHPFSLSLSCSLTPLALGRRGIRHRGRKCRPGATSSQEMVGEDATEAETSREKGWGNTQDSTRSLQRPGEEADGVGERLCSQTEEHWERKPTQMPH